MAHKGVRRLPLSVVLGLDLAAFAFVISGTTSWSIFSFIFVCLFSVAAMHFARVTGRYSRKSAPICFSGMKSCTAGQAAMARIRRHKTRSNLKNFTNYFHPTGKRPDEFTKMNFVYSHSYYDRTLSSFSDRWLYPLPCRLVTQMRNLAPDWTVAIVDDQPDARELLTYALKATFPRIQILEPTSPGWLLDHLHEHQVAAVVTRYKLFGGMNGLLFSALLRSAHFGGPIIMVSNSEEIANQIHEAGINEFLSFDRWSELPARLALQLQKQTADSALPESA